MRLRAAGALLACASLAALAVGGAALQHAPGPPPHPPPHPPHDPLDVLASGAAPTRPPHLALSLPATATLWEDTPSSVLAELSLGGAAAPNSGGEHDSGSGDDGIVIEVMLPPLPSGGACGALLFDYRWLLPSPSHAVTGVRLVEGDDAAAAAAHACAAYHPLRRCLTRAVLAGAAEPVLRVVRRVQYAPAPHAWGIDAARVDVAVQGAAPHTGTHHDNATTTHATMRLTILPLNDPPTVTVAPPAPDHRGLRAVPVMVGGTLRVGALAAVTVADPDLLEAGRPRPPPCLLQPPADATYDGAPLRHQRWEVGVVEMAVAVVGGHGAVCVGGLDPLPYWVGLVAGRNHSEAFTLRGPLAEVNAVLGRLAFVAASYVPAGVVGTAVVVTADDLGATGCVVGGDGEGGGEPARGTGSATLHVHFSSPPEPPTLHAAAAAAVWRVPAPAARARLPRTWVAHAASMRYYPRAVADAVAAQHGAWPQDAALLEATGAPLLALTVELVPTGALALPAAVAALLTGATCRDAAVTTNASLSGELRCNCGAAPRPSCLGVTGTLGALQLVLASLEINTGVGSGVPDSATLTVTAAPASGPATAHTLSLRVAMGATEDSLHVTAPAIVVAVEDSAEPLPLCGVTLVASTELAASLHPVLLVAAAWHGTLSLSNCATSEAQPCGADVAIWGAAAEEAVDDMRAGAAASRATAATAWLDAALGLLRQAALHSPADVLRRGSAVARQLSGGGETVAGPLPPPPPLPPSRHVLLVFGSLASVERALRRLEYAPAANWSGNDAVSLLATAHKFDGGGDVTNATAVVRVRVTPVNDAPTIHARGAATVHVAEALAVPDGDALPLPPLDVDDVDAAPGEVFALDVRTSCGGLSVAPHVTPGLSCTRPYPGVLACNGTLDALQAALTHGALVYASPGHARPGTPCDGDAGDVIVADGPRARILVTVRDGAGATAAVSVDVTVLAVPQLTTLRFEQGDGSTSDARAQRAAVVLDAHSVAVQLLQPPTAPPTRVALVDLASAASLLGNTTCRSDDAACPVLAGVVLDPQWHGSNDPQLLLLRASAGALSVRSVPLDAVVDAWTVPSAAAGVNSTRGDPPSYTQLALLAPVPVLRELLSGVTYMPPPAPRDGRHLQPAGVTLAVVSPATAACAAAYPAVAALLVMPVGAGTSLHGCSWLAARMDIHVTAQPTAMVVSMPAELVVREAAVREWRRGRVASLQLPDVNLTAGDAVEPIQAAIWLDGVHGSWPLLLSLGRAASMALDAHCEAGSGGDDTGCTRLELRGTPNVLAAAFRHSVRLRAQPPTALTPGDERQLQWEYGRVCVYASHNGSTAGGVPACTTVAVQRAVAAPRFAADATGALPPPASVSAVEDVTVTLPALAVYAPFASAVRLDAVSALCNILVPPVTPSPALQLSQHSRSNVTAYGTPDAVNELLRRGLRLQPDADTNAAVCAPWASLSLTLQDVSRSPLLARGGGGVTGDAAMAELAASVLRQRAVHVLAVRVEPRDDEPLLCVVADSASASCATVPLSTPAAASPPPLHAALVRNDGSVSRDTRLPPSLRILDPDAACGDVSHISEDGRRMGRALRASLRASQSNVSLTFDPPAASSAAVLALHVTWEARDSGQGLDLQGTAAAVTSALTRVRVVPPASHFGAMTVTLQLALVGSHCDACVATAVFATDLPAANRAPLVLLAGVVAPTNRVLLSCVEDEACALELALDDPDGAALAAAGLGSGALELRVGAPTTPHDVALNWTAPQGAFNGDDGVVVVDVGGPGADAALTVRGAQGAVNAWLAAARLILVPAPDHYGAVSLPLRVIELPLRLGADEAHAVPPLATLLDVVATFRAVVDAPRVTVAASELRLQCGGAAVPIPALTIVDPDAVTLADDPPPSMATGRALSLTARVAPSRAGASPAASIVRATTDAAAGLAATTSVTINVHSVRVGARLRRYLIAPPAWASGADTAWGGAQLNVTACAAGVSPAMVCGWAAIPIVVSCGEAAAVGAPSAGGRVLQRALPAAPVRLDVRDSPHELFNRPDAGGVLVVASMQLNVSSDLLSGVGAIGGGLPLVAELSCATCASVAIHADASERCAPSLAAAASAAGRSSDVAACVVAAPSATVVRLAGTLASLAAAFVHPVNYSRFAGFGVGTPPADTLTLSISATDSPAALTRWFDGLAVEGNTSTARLFTVRLGGLPPRAPSISLPPQLSLLPATGRAPLRVLVEPSCAASAGLVSGVAAEQLRVTVLISARGGAVVDVPRDALASAGVSASTSSAEDVCGWRNLTLHGHATHMAAALSAAYLTAEPRTVCEHGDVIVVAGAWHAGGPASFATAFAVVPVAASISFDGGSAETRIVRPGGVLALPAIVTQGIAAYASVQLHVSCTLGRLLYPAALARSVDVAAALDNRSLTLRGISARVQLAVPVVTFEADADEDDAPGKRIAIVSARILGDATQGATASTSLRVSIEPAPRCFRAVVAPNTSAASSNSVGAMPVVSLALDGQPATTPLSPRQASALVQMELVCSGCEVGFATNAAVDDVLATAAGGTVVPASELVGLRRLPAFDTTCYFERVAFTATAAAASALLAGLQPALHVEDAGTPATVSVAVAAVDTLAHECARSVLEVPLPLHRTTAPVSLAVPTYRDCIEDVPCSLSGAALHYSAADAARVVEVKLSTTHGTLQFELPDALLPVFAGRRSSTVLPAGDGDPCTAQLVTLHGRASAVDAALRMLQLVPRADAWGLAAVSARVTADAVGAAANDAAWVVLHIAPVADLPELWVRQSVAGGARVGDIQLRDADAASGVSCDGRTSLSHSVAASIQHRVETPRSLSLTVNCTGGCHVTLGHAYTLGLTALSSTGPHELRVMGQAPALQAALQHIRVVHTSASTGPQTGRVLPGVTVTLSDDLRGLAASVFLPDAVVDSAHPSTPLLSISSRALQVREDEEVALGGALALSGPADLAVRVRLHALHGGSLCHALNLAQQLPNSGAGAVPRCQSVLSLTGTLSEIQCALGVGGGEDPTRCAGRYSYAAAADAWGTEELDVELVERGMPDQASHTYRSATARVHVAVLPVPDHLVLRVSGDNGSVVLAWSDVVVPMGATAAAPPSAEQLLLVSAQCSDCTLSLAAGCDSGAHGQRGNSSARLGFAASFATLSPLLASGIGQSASSCIHAARGVATFSPSWILVLLLVTTPHGDTSELNVTVQTTSAAAEPVVALVDGRPLVRLPPGRLVDHTLFRLEWRAGSGIAPAPLTTGAGGVDRYLLLASSLYGNASIGPGERCVSFSPTVALATSLRLCTLSVPAAELRERVAGVHYARDDADPSRAYVDAVVVSVVPDTHSHSTSLAGQLLRRGYIAVEAAAVRACQGDAAVFSASVASAKSAVLLSVPVTARPELSLQAGSTAPVTLVRGVPLRLPAVYVGPPPPAPRMGFGLCGSVPEEGRDNASSVHVLACGGHDSQLLLNLNQSVAVRFGLTAAASGCPSGAVCVTGALPDVTAALAAGDLVTVLSPSLMQTWLLADAGVVRSPSDCGSAVVLVILADRAGLELRIPLTTVGDATPPSHLVPLQPRLLAAAGFSDALQVEATTLRSGPTAGSPLHCEEDSVAAAVPAWHLLQPSQSPPPALQLVVSAERGRVTYVGAAEPAAEQFTVAGDVRAVNIVLGQLLYTPVPDANGGDAIKMQITERTGAVLAEAAVVVAVAAVPDALRLAANGTVLANTSAASLPRSLLQPTFNALRVIDVDLSGDVIVCIRHWPDLRFSVPASRAVGNLVVLADCDTAATGEPCSTVLRGDAAHVNDGIASLVLHSGSESADSASHTVTIVATRAGQPGLSVLVHYSVTPPRAPPYASLAAGGNAPRTLELAEDGVVYLATQALHDADAAPRSTVTLTIEGSYSASDDVHACVALVMDAHAFAEDEQSVTTQLRLSDAPVVPHNVTMTPNCCSASGTRLACACDGCNGAGGAAETAGTVLQVGVSGPLHDVLTALHGAALSPLARSCRLIVSIRGAGDESAPSGAVSAHIDVVIAATPAPLPRLVLPEVVFAAAEHQATQLPSELHPVTSGLSGAAFILSINALGTVGMPTAAIVPGLSLLTATAQRWSARGTAVTLSLAWQLLRYRPPPRATNDTIAVSLHPASPTGAARGSVVSAALQVAVQQVDDPPAFIVATPTVWVRGVVGAAVVISGTAVVDDDSADGTLLAVELTASFGSVQLTSRAHSDADALLVSHDGGRMTLVGTQHAVNSALARLLYTVTRLYSPEADEHDATAADSDTLTLAVFGAEIRPDGNGSTAGPALALGSIRVMFDDASEPFQIVAAGTAVVAEDSTAYLGDVVTLSHTGGRADTREGLSDDPGHLDVVVDASPWALLTAPADACGAGGCISSQLSASLVRVVGSEPAAILRAIRRVQYTPAPDWHGAATIRITAIDATGVGVPARTTLLLPITVLAVNDPPTLLVACPSTLPASTPLCLGHEDADLQLGPHLTLADPDGGSMGVYTVGVSAAPGTLVLPARDLPPAWVPAWVSGAYGDGVFVGGYLRSSHVREDAAVQLSGDVHHVSAQLAGLVYRPPRDWSGVAHITFTATDGLDASFLQLDVDVAAAPDPPRLVIPPHVSRLDFADGGAAALPAVELVDADEPAHTPYTLELSCARCAWSPHSAFQHLVRPAQGGDAGRVVLTGGLLELQAALRATRVVAPAGYFGNSSLTLTLTDATPSSLGGPLSGAVTLSGVVCEPPEALQWALPHGVPMSQPLVALEDTELWLNVSLRALVWTSAAAQPSLEARAVNITVQATHGGVSSTSTRGFQPVLHVNGTLRSLAAELASLRYLPAPNWNSLSAGDAGLAAVTLTALYTASHGPATLTRATVLLLVLPTNDAPSLLLRDDVPVEYSTTRRMPDGMSAQLERVSRPPAVQQGGALSLDWLSVRDADFDEAARGGWLDVRRWLCAGMQLHIQIVCGGENSSSEAPLDAAPPHLTATLSSSNGTLRASDGGSIPPRAGARAFSSRHGRQLELRGSPRAVSAGLAAAVYLPDAGFSGRDELVVRVDDGGSTGLAVGAPSLLTITRGLALASQLLAASFVAAPAAHELVIPIDVTAVDIAPVLAFTNVLLSVDEDSTLLLTDAQLTLHDSDAAADTAAALTLTCSHGTLTVGSTLDSIAVSVAGDGTDSLRVAGAYGLLLALLERGVVYTPAHDFHSGRGVMDELHGAAQVGNGAINTSCGIRVRPVDDAPTLRLADALRAPVSVRVSEDDAVTISGLNVAHADDPGGGTFELRVTVAVNHGSLVVSAATAALLDSYDIGGWCSHDGNEPAAQCDLPLARPSLTFGGALADITAALRTLTYAPARDYFGADSLTVRAENAGDGGLFAVEEVHIAVEPVNDPPLWILPPDAALLAVRGDAALWLRGTAVTDADNVGGSLRVAVSVQVDTGTISAWPGDSLGALNLFVLPGADNLSCGPHPPAAGTPATAKAVSGMQFLTLWGTLSSVNAALAALVYSPPAASERPIREASIRLHTCDEHATATATLRVRLTRGTDLPPKLLLPGSRVDADHELCTLPPCTLRLLAPAVTLDEDEEAAVLPDVVVFDADASGDPAGEEGMLLIAAEAVHGAVRLRATYNDTSSLHVARQLNRVPALGVAGDSWSTSLQFVCLAAECTQLLRRLAFRGDPHFHGAARVNVTVQDADGAAATCIIPVIVLPINDPVRVTYDAAADAVLGAQEDSWVAVPGFQVTDADDDSGLDGEGLYTVVLTATRGLLLLPVPPEVVVEEPVPASTATNSDTTSAQHQAAPAFAAPDTWTVGGGHDTLRVGEEPHGQLWPASVVSRRVAVTGQLVQLRGALAGLLFRAEADWNSQLAGGELAAVQLNASDNGHSGRGSPSSAAASINVRVAPADDPPRLRLADAVAPGGTPDAAAEMVIEEDAAAMLLPLLTLSDADDPAGASLATLYLRAGHGALVLRLSCEKLALQPLTLLEGACPPSGSVRVQGPSSVLSSLLQGLSYRPHTDTYGRDDVVVSTMDDTGLTHTVTLPVRVTPVNDAPVVHGPGGSASAEVTLALDEGSTAAIAGVSLHDVYAATGVVAHALSAEGDGDGTGVELWATTVFRPASHLPWAAAPNASTAGLGVRGPEEDWRLRLVADVAAGGGGSDPRELTLLGSGRVVFSATSPSTGRELFITGGGGGGSGGLQGASLLLDLMPGTGGSNPAHITPLDAARVLFAADGRDVASWMAGLAGDACESFRASMATAPDEMGEARGLRYAVSSSNVWQAGRVYDCPAGYTWATTSQAADLLVAWGRGGLEGGTAAASPPLRRPRAAITPVYANQCGWSGTTPPFAAAASAATAAAVGTPVGTWRRFRFADSHETGGYKDASGLEGDPPGNGDFSVDDFAGVVCVSVPGADGGGRATGVVAGGGGAEVGIAASPAGRELWVSDGTPAGTRRLADVQPGPAGSNPGSLVRLLLPPPAGGPLASPVTRVVFAADTRAFGRELFVTDGSAGGTTLLADVRPGGLGSDPAYLCPIPSTAAPGTHAGAYFAADDGVHGVELWVTTGLGAAVGHAAAFPGVGAPAATRLVADVAPGPASSAPSDLYAVPADGFTASAPAQLHPGVVLFAAQGMDGAGRELWASDGLAGGTRQVADVCPGPRSSSPAWFTAFAGRVFFAATDCVAGVELWATDGSPAGTARVADVSPGVYSGFPAMLTVLSLERYGGGGAAAQTLAFVAAVGGSADGVDADDALVAAQVWVSDGSPAGTRPALDALVTAPYFHVPARALFPRPDDWPRPQLLQVGADVLVAAARGGRRAATASSSSADSAAPADATVSFAVTDVDDVGGYYTAELWVEAGKGALFLPGAADAPSGALNWLLPDDGGGGGASPRVLLNATLPGLNAALSRVVFQGGVGRNGADAVSLRVHEAGSRGGDAVARVRVALAPSNDAPTISFDDAPLLRVASSRELAVGVRVGDTDVEEGAVVDGGGTPRGGLLSVTLTASAGRISLATLTGLTLLNGTTGVREARVAFTGAVRDVSRALAATRYVCAPPDGCEAGAHTLVGVVEDGGYSGRGGPLSAWAEAVVQVHE